MVHRGKDRLYLTISSQKVPALTTEWTNGACFITKTRLYSFDPLKPHLYIVKLGFTGVYIIFLISAQKHRLWVLVRTASAPKHRLCGYSLGSNEYPQSIVFSCGSNEYPQSMFLSRNMKNIRVFYLKFFSFWRWVFLYIWIGVFS